MQRTSSQSSFAPFSPYKPPRALPPLPKVPAATSLPKTAASKSRGRWSERSADDAGEDSSDGQESSVGEGSSVHDHAESRSEEPYRLSSPPVSIRARLNSAASPFIPRHTEKSGDSATRSASRSSMRATQIFVRYSASRDAGSQDNSTSSTSEAIETLRDSQATPLISTHKVRSGGASDESGGLSSSPPVTARQPQDAAPVAALQPVSSSPAAIPKKKESLRQWFVRAIESLNRPHSERMRRWRIISRAKFAQKVKATDGDLIAQRAARMPYGRGKNHFADQGDLEVSVHLEKARLCLSKEKFWEAEIQAKSIRARHFHEGKSSEDCKEDLKKLKKLLNIKQAKWSPVADGKSFFTPLLEKYNPDAVHSYIDDQLIRRDETFSSLSSRVQNFEKSVLNEVFSLHLKEEYPGSVIAAAELKRSDIMNSLLDLGKLKAEFEEIDKETFQDMINEWGSDNVSFYVEAELALPLPVDNERRAKLKRCAQLLHENEKKLKGIPQLAPASRDARAGASSDGSSSRTPPRLKGGAGSRS